jgi:hypothetical protein
MYYAIIEEFRNKLPRPQNCATEISIENREKSGIPSLKYINVVEMSAFKTSITEADIDLFYNKLEYFDYSFILFPNHYRKFTENLKRFKPKAQDKNFDLFVLQQILKDNPLKPLHPIPVLIHHLKWEIKWTSRFYHWVSRLKRTRHIL